MSQEEGKELEPQVALPQAPRTGAYNILLAVFAAIVLVIVLFAVLTYPSLPPKPTTPDQNLAKQSSGLYKTKNVFLNNVLRVVQVNWKSIVFISILSVLILASIVIIAVLVSKESLVEDPEDQKLVTKKPPKSWSKAMWASTVGVVVISIVAVVLIIKLTSAPKQVVKSETLEDLLSQKWTPKHVKIGETPKKEIDKTTFVHNFLEQFNSDNITNTSESVYFLSRLLVLMAWARQIQKHPDYNVKLSEQQRETVNAIARGIFSDDDLHLGTYKDFSASQLSTHMAKRTDELVEIMTLLEMHVNAYPNLVKKCKEILMAIMTDSVELAIKALKEVIPSESFESDAPVNSQASSSEGHSGSESDYESD